MQMLLVILLGLAVDGDPGVTSACQGELDSVASSERSEATVIQIGDLGFNADRVLLKSTDKAEAGHFSCTLEGHAKLVLFSGDIEISAENIQFEMRGDTPASVRCSGTCTFRQDDNSNEILSGDNLTFGRDGLMIAGNATIQYRGDGDNTLVTCDSLTVSKDGYDLSGKVRLRHDRSE